MDGGLAERKNALQSILECRWTLNPGVALPIWRRPTWCKGSTTAGMTEVQRRGFLTRLTAYEPLTLITVASIAGGLFVLQRLTSEVLEGETFRFDEAILMALRRPGELAVPIGPGWLTHAVDDITSLGGITVLSLMTVLVTVYLLLDRRWPIAIFVFSSVLTGWLASTLLKILVARPRPDIVPHLVEVSDLSFPPGMRWSRR